ncbi:uncharacterized protein LOC142240981 [Haematobia irritans]|uniref:uncharacterized protein LOC142240981 n=1 Tax=Haematobia irritans TaxID=7368 RepID=UPI003F5020F7
MFLKLSCLLIAWLCFLDVTETKTVQTLGYIHEGEEPFQFTKVRHEAKWLLKHDILVVQPAEGKRNFKKLTAIRITDYSDAENRATVSLVEGGPGHTYSTLRIISPFRSPLKLLIEYFGNSKAPLRPVEDFVWGEIKPGDVMIGRRMIDTRPAEELEHVEKIVFPLEGQTNNKTLSAIRFVDRTNTVASVNYNSGGPGHTFANMIVRSRFKTPLHMTVEYYSSKNEPGNTWRP